MKLKSISSNNPIQVNILDKEKRRWILKDDRLIRRIEAESEMEMREVRKRLSEQEMLFHKRLESLADAREELEKNARKGGDKESYREAIKEWNKRWSNLQGQWQITVKRGNREMEEIMRRRYQRIHAIKAFLR
jgi:hypothetical protein